MPSKVSKSLASSSMACCSYTIAAILLLSKIMPSLYFCYVKEGLVYIVLASPLSQQPSSYLEYTKVNI